MAFIYKKKRKSVLILLKFQFFSSTLEAKSDLRSNQCLLMRAAWLSNIWKNLWFPSYRPWHGCHMWARKPQAIWMPFLTPCQKLTQAICFTVPQTLVCPKVHILWTTECRINWVFHASTSEDGVIFLPRWTMSCLWHQWIALINW